MRRRTSLSLRHPQAHPHTPPRYEVPAFQRSVRARFDELRAEVTAQDPALWVQVDAAGSIEDIHARLLLLARERIAAAAQAPLLALWRGAPLEE